MIELLLVAGLVALGLLLAVTVLFVLHQRRQGTVRAVFMPRRRSENETPDGAAKG